MKTNTSVLLSPTAIASILVVLSSLSIGLATGFLSFYLGAESLTGVTSPEENPTQKINNKSDNEGQGTNFQLISEQKILVKVYDQIHKAREESKVKEQQKQ
ncbi:hypothetical protein [Geminocystis sp. NIES-3709]|uniref:hypothetical protein n=1 Tax=Geminocystis sp. NIES-3709 TaxID=1617448 RepID=UPI0005FCABF9|nr:hypothetical protein [Geminocystis sp. NIES-3709]BAQ66529.1 hypothetical protein GM3709_3294 [Geminocystis sp. NIES-3709]